MKHFLECCCTSIEELTEAQKMGASRIELCENLECGGTTPSDKLIRQAVAASSIPVNVLIRCRGGDFLYDENEIETMLQSINTCKDAGVNGVVIGALDANGDIDTATMQRMMSAAGNLSITFHRAFDVCRNPYDALEDILRLSCDRLLTSGHEQNAYEGRFTIAELVQRSAASPLIVMAGCGVRRTNIDEIVHVTGVKECHASFIYFKETEYE